MCTFRSCGFSHLPSEPREAVVRAGRCLCCVPTLPHPFPYSHFLSAREHYFKYGWFIFGVLIPVLGLFFLFEICSRKSYPFYNFPCFYQAPGELHTSRRWLGGRYYRNRNNRDGCVGNRNKRQESPSIFHFQLTVNAQCLARVEIK